MIYYGIPYRLFWQLSTWLYSCILIILSTIAVLTIFSIAHAETTHSESVQSSNRLRIKTLIEDTISIGVPLYNMGDAKACRDVYRITLRAIQLLSPTLVNSKSITLALKQITKESAQKGAWRLRGILDNLYQKMTQPSHSKTTKIMSSNQKTDQSFTLNFDTITSWYSLNDNVMGGISQGKLTQEYPGIAIYSGRLSRQNNGGFSSVRTHISLNSLASYQGVILKVRGDHRRYEFLVTSANQQGSWQASFIAPKQWSEIRIPFASMKLSIRGWSPPSNPPIQSINISKIGLLIKDKIDTPFRLELDWIQPY